MGGGETSSKKVVPRQGRITLDSNPVERALRRAALVYSLIETCKLNGVDPYAYLKIEDGAIIRASRPQRQGNDGHWVNGTRAPRPIHSDSAAVPTL